MLSQIPLVAVELAYGSKFDLQANDAEILIQLPSGAVLWQKERLLNVALQALPSSCRKVAWLDCDIFFGSPDWIERANSLLDRFALIQLFRQVHNLGPQWAPGEDWRSHVQFPQPSAAFSLASGTPAAFCLGRRFGSRNASCATGHAWAARREVLDRHFFFDASIIGGGDRAMVCAAHGCFDELMKIYFMNEQQRQRYISWAEPYYETIRAETAFLDGEIFHLWHGDFVMRKAAERLEGLQPFQFNPYTDIAIGEGGSWRWNSDKPEMHQYVRKYFASRQEDG